MKDKITLCVAVFAVIFGQACSKNSDEETSERFSIDEGYFIGDSAKVKTDGKFLCDFQWTPGPKFWNYKSESGDKPVNEKKEANEPWCLIPYGDSTEFFITITVQSEEKLKDCVCRDLDAEYSFKNEETIDLKYPLLSEIEYAAQRVIVEGYEYVKIVEEYEYEYETHKQMMCVPIDNVVVTANNPQIEYKDEKIYHVILNTDSIYTIEGHINLRLVKPIHLTVMWEPILYGSEYWINPDKTRNDWKMYMEKVGYYIDIITVPIFFPNNMESVNDRKLTLPAEKDVLSKNLTGWFNGSESDRKSDLEYFGAESDLSRVNQANYVIITTTGYDFRHKANAKFEGVNGYNPDGYNQCISPSTAANLLEKVSSSNISNIQSSLSSSYFDKNESFIAFGSPYDNGFGYVIIPSENTKSKCENVAEVRYENYGTNAFSITNGYVLSHPDFYTTQNRGRGRLLASLLYSAILTIPNPINGNDKLWLSSYSENTDIEQPMRFWRNYPPKNRQQQIQELIPLPEFAFIFKKQERNLK